MNWFSAATRRTAGATLALGCLTALTACSTMHPAPPNTTAGVVPAAPTGNDASMAAAQALGQYNWQLENAGIVALPTNLSKRPMLRFVPEPPGTTHSGRVVLDNLCNTQSSSYTLGNGSLTLGTAMSTMKACADDALMRLERGLGQQLGTIERWHIEHPFVRSLTTEQHPAELTLKLFLRDGSAWLLRGTPNDELRLGGAPQRVFLEVAPDTIPCSRTGSPAGAGAPCLRVRTISYNDQWIKQPPGEWREFHGQIEGFQHEPGYRKVLRLNHWEKRNVYVLDMVVETEIVRR